MASDEAVLRIITEADESARGGYSEEASQRAEPFRAPGGEYVPANEKAVWQKLISETFGDSGGQSGRRSKIEPQEREAEEFDPAKLAQARLDKEKKLRQVEDEYRKLNPAQPDAPFDPVKLAQDRLDKEKKLQQIEAEYAKLSPQKAEEFDPAKAARARFDKEKQAADVQTAYEKINPPKPESPFDPMAEAQKRVAKDRQESAVEAEVAKLKQQGGIEGILNKAFAKMGMRGSAPATAAGGGMSMAGLGGAAAGLGSAFIGAQMTPEGASRIGAGAGYDGGKGVAAAMGANFMNQLIDTIPVVSHGLQAWGASLDANAQKIDVETSARVVEITSNDRFRAEIIRSTQRLKELESELGTYSRLFNEEYRELKNTLPEIRQHYEQQRAFAARGAALAPFSPQITGAQATNRVGAQRIGIAEANFAGKEFAEFLQKQGQSERLSQQVNALEQMKDLKLETKIMNGNIAKQQHQLEDLYKQNQARIDDDAADRKRQAKNDDERLKIEKDRLDQQKRLTDLVKENMRSNLEDLISGMNPPGDEKSDKKEQDQRDAMRVRQSLWNFGMEAFKI